MSQQRRELPRVRIDKSYEFDSDRGRVSLGDLFEGRSQLAVYPFMFDPDWGEGCKSCSFWADNYQGAIGHLAQRDVTLVTIPRAPLPKLQAFKQRMGWRFEWVSSFGSDFNRDFHVSFTPEETNHKVWYNYAMRPFGSTEAPGASIFYRYHDGDIYHTYSCYSRGLDALNGTYQWLDLAPKGGDEDGLSNPQSWVRHHDKYGT